MMLLESPDLSTHFHLPSGLLELLEPLLDTTQLHLQLLHLQAAPTTMGWVQSRHKVEGAVCKVAE